MGWIGEDTDKLLYPLVINLSGFLQDTTLHFAPIKLNKVNIIEDGHRYTTFGNVAGGRWTGKYKYFIIKDNEENNQVISISILGSLKCKNDPKFGNRKGHTTLVVAIDDFDKSHNSLQLNIDKYTYIKNNKFIIWHDGTITVGKSGAAKREELINYIRNNDHGLLNDSGLIQLGNFDSKKQIIWSQNETRNFIEKLIRYAIIRDKFRRYKRELN